MAPGTNGHWLGTDDLGRDIFERATNGIRLSMTVAIVVTVISVLVGVTLGGLAGSFGGWGDTLISRFIDTWQVIPFVLIGFAIMEYEDDEARLLLLAVVAAVILLAEHLALAAILAVVALVFVVWEILGHTVFDKDFISPPSAIALALPRVLKDPAILWALALSFYQLVVAFVLALIGGVLIGAAVGLKRFATKSLLPLILLAYSIPQVTILPLFVLWFGVDSASKIAFGSLLSIPAPARSAAVWGAISIPPNTTAERSGVWRE